jgi:hypothetical protein
MTLLEQGLSYHHWFENSGCGFTELAGNDCITSQCSTIQLPLNLK